MARINQTNALKNASKTFIDYMNLLRDMNIAPIIYKGKIILVQYEDVYNGDDIISYKIVDTLPQKADGSYEGVMPLMNTDSL